MRVASTQAIIQTMVRPLTAGERLVTGALRPPGRLVPVNQPSQRTDVVPVGLTQASPLVRVPDPRGLIIDVYV